jgi:hypothetical protein
VEEGQKVPRWCPHGLDADSAVPHRGVCAWTRGVVCHCANTFPGFRMPLGSSSDFSCAVQTEMGGRVGQQTLPHSPTHTHVPFAYTGGGGEEQKRTPVPHGSATGCTTGGVRARGGRQGGDVHCRPTRDGKGPPSAGGACTCCMRCTLGSWPRPMPRYCALACPSPCSALMLPPRSADGRSGT